MTILRQALLVLCMNFGRGWGLLHSGEAAAPSRYHRHNRSLADVAEDRVAMKLRGGAERRLARSGKRRQYVFGEKNHMAVLPFGSFASLVDLRLINNNLGGLGPGPYSSSDPEPTILYATDETECLLEVSNTTAYMPKASTKNGIDGNFGVINVNANSSAGLKFRFVDSNGVDVNIPVFQFALFDMDMSAAHDAIESAVASGYDEWLVSPDSTIEVTGHPDGTHTFTATEVGTATDNPKDPSHLTPTQMQRSFGLLYLDRSSIEITFSVAGGQSGRNFMFLVQLGDPDNVAHEGALSDSEPNHQPTPYEMAAERDYLHAVKESAPGDPQPVFPIQPSSDSTRVGKRQHHWVFLAFILPSLGCLCCWWLCCLGGLKRRQWFSHESWLFYARNELRYDSAKAELEWQRMLRESAKRVKNGELVCAFDD
mmetsp:Transcript_22904/g.64028  ORF Transcript_22904/g.64028 Transcript_22904/m.64028 type:complete len:426 (+) Transcript_22904:136-1413(+)